MKKFAIVLGIAAVSGVFCALVLYSSNAGLKSSLEQARMESGKYQEEITRVTGERERVAKELERLQQDSVAYLSLNSKLQEENRKLLVSLEDSRQAVKVREEALGKQRKKLLEKEKLPVVSDDQLARLEEMKGKIAEMEQALADERRRYLYNLGVAYTRAGMYDEAIASYEQTLALGDDNAEAHYNLGLIYERVKHLPAKAAGHYRQFLKIAPTDPDAQEVTEWVRRLAPEA